ncbi:MAG: ammonia channel protein, partial [Limisphaerales bacterium]
MKTTLICLSLLLVLAMRPVATLAADAAAPGGSPTPKLKAPSVEERLADLEAYMNNGARGNAANTNLD